MATPLNIGDIVYAGYPTVHVHDFRRNSKGQLKFGKIKELLWGDWIKVIDYDYRTSDNADIKNATEQSFVDQKISDIHEMVQVRVRGRSGYMFRYDVEENRLLEVVFCDVGQGDGALLVTPEDKKYVIDAGISDHMYRYLKWRFAGFKNEHTDFDGLILTHPDQDHYFGFNALIEDPEVQADNIWHNGIMEQFDTDQNGSQLSPAKSSLGKMEVDDGQKYLVDLVETDGDLEAFLQNEDRWIKQSNNGQPKRYPDLMHGAFNAKNASNNRRFPNIAMLSTAHGEQHGDSFYLPGFTPDNANSCSLEIMGPVVEPDASGKNRLRVFGTNPVKKGTSLDTGKTKNGHSILFKLKYRQMTLFFGGDLNSPAELFLLDQATDLDVYEEIDDNPQIVVDATRETFRCDITKACHHGSADFTNSFLGAMNAVATVISSGDNESHAHPRSDTLGAIGHYGRGERSLIFSTELARSTEEYTNKEDTPWGQAMKLQVKAAKETDPIKKNELETEIERLLERDKKLNVTVYGAINLRSDGEKVVLAYMLEKPSKTNRWDVYTLEPNTEGVLHYRKADKDSDASKKRKSKFEASN